MDTTTDWLLLWRQIVEEHAKRREQQETDKNESDDWTERARNFDSGVKERWNKPDSSRSFVISRLREHPGSTLLDIGAGTGAWACLLAPYVKQLTALDPSPAMISVLQENIAEKGIKNINIIQGQWPQATTEKHDFSLCSHAMYGEPDFKEFIERMVDVTRKTCFLLLRVPTPSGLMAELSMRIWGHPHDSPNFHVAYNALLQMSICPNVLMEDTGLWRPWTNDSLEDAVADVKRRFCIEGVRNHDEFIAEKLSHHLTLEDGKYVWPKGVRSALVYWGV